MPMQPSPMAELFWPDFPSGIWRIFAPRRQQIRMTAILQAPHRPLKNDSPAAEIMAQRLQRKGLQAPRKQGGRRGEPPLFQPSYRACAKGRTELSNDALE